MDPIANFRMMMDNEDRVVDHIMMKQWEEKVEKAKAREEKLRSLKHRATFVPKMLADADAGLKRAQAMPDTDPGKAEALESAKKNLSNRQRDAGRYPAAIEKAEAERPVARA